MTPPLPAPADPTEADRVEIRRNEDGSLDEVVLHVGGEVVFHLEQMNGDHWWAGLYPRDQRRWMLDFTSKRRITARCEED